MSSVWHRLVYAVCTVIAAVLLLAGTSAAVGYVRASSDVRVENSDRRLTMDYLAYNRRADTHVFRASNMLPGTIDRRLLVVGNDGKRYVRRIAIYQDQVVDTGFSSALRIQLWDRTTNRCIYPAPRSGVPPFGRCRHWGAWDASNELDGRAITPKWGVDWRPGERHVIQIRYALRPWSTNSDQEQEASFRLRWRYYG